MKRILIATDGSKQAENAAKLFAHFPHDGKLEITVLSVVQNSESYHRYAPKDWVKRFVEQQRVVAEKSYENIKEIFAGSNATLNHVIQPGHIGQTIVKVGEDLDVDLIVIGAVGHSTLSRMLLGSTSDFVATHATSSVLIVRPDSESKASADSTMERSLRVTLAYQDDTTFAPMKDEFSQFRWEAGVDVDIVTAVVNATWGPYGDLDPWDELIDQSTEAVNQAKDQLSDVVGSCTATVLRPEHTAEGIVQHVEAKGSDLLLVGEANRSKLGRMLLGSVSRYLIRHAPCSVWIMKSRSQQPNETSDIKPNQECVH